MKLQIILILTNTVLLVTLSFLFYKIIYANRKMAENTAKNTVVLANYIAQIFFLTDVLAEVLPPPLRMIYQQFRVLDPNLLPKNKKEEFEFLKDIALKRFLLGRETIIEALKTEEDPIIKEKLKTHLLEIEGIMDLLNSTGKDTSEEYMSTIMANLMASMFKLSGNDNA